MTGHDPRVDQIVEELMEKPLTKPERIALLRELVREGEEMPDELLSAALGKLMERLAGGN